MSIFVWAIVHFKHKYSLSVHCNCFHFRLRSEEEERSSLTSLCDFLKIPPPSPSVYFIMMITSINSHASDVIKIIRQVLIRIFPRNILV